MGPRPPLPEEVECYTEYQKQRLKVLLGITCTWHIMPERNDMAFHAWVEMDLDYIEHRCFLVNLKLILKTLLAMLHKGGR